jgi:ADP-ribosyl-[dinitrogen reductase] hydrolase
MNHESLTACLLGGALGDSIGLPYEGLQAKRIQRLLKGPLRQRLILGSGMFSDDTEHAAATILSLTKAGADPAIFTRDLARRLRWWFAGIPAGIGLATARSIIRLWCGVSPTKSGVWSAGNGPLMRAPSIGVFHSQRAEERAAFVTASTKITHSDPLATECALMVAEAASFACNAEGSILDRLDALAVSNEMKSRLGVLRSSLNASEDVAVFADRIGRRPGFVSGYVPDTAAVAIFAWLRHRGDFRQTLESVIRAGGDTDTVAFVAGSLAGIDVGAEGLPEEWLENVKDRPLSVKSLRRIASGEAVGYPLWPLSLVRNFFFFLVILCHVFRRALPPY